MNVSSGPPAAMVPASPYRTAPVAPAEPVVPVAPVRRGGVVVLAGFALVAAILVVAWLLLAR